MQTKYSKLCYTNLGIRLNICNKSIEFEELFRIIFTCNRFHTKFVSNGILLRLMISSFYKRKNNYRNIFVVKLKFRYVS